MSRKVRVPLHGKPQGFATIDPEATKGATVGTDLYWSDGSLVTPEELQGLTVRETTVVRGGVNTQPTISLWSILQNIPANIAALAALAGAGLVTRLADNSFVVRTLEAVAGRIVVTNGDGAINPTVDLAELADGGGGSLQRIARDAYGRVSGTSAATTDHLTEGATNLYYTDARADARVVAGLATHATASIASSENLVAGDYVNVWNDAGTAKVRKADASTASAAKRAMGFVLAAVTSPANATVYFRGKNTALAGLTPGTTYALSATVPGGVVALASATTTAGHILQQLGNAYSTTAIHTAIAPPTIRG